MTLAKPILRPRTCASVLAVAALAAPSLAHASDPAGLPPPPNGFADRRDVPHGEVERSLTYPTRNYPDQKVTIYTPPGYSTDQTYPVLYLHHGIGGNEVAWVSSEGNADNVMDNLYAEELAVPMIVVMPDGNTDGANDGFGEYGDVLLNDLIPWIEANYPASSDADMRAIAGLSMGGGQTYNFGFPNPHIFHYLGSFSAAPNSANPASGAFPDVDAVREQMRVIFLSCGTVDGLLSNTVRFHDFLDQNDIPHIYQLEEGEDHTPLVWNRSLYNFAQRIFRDVDAAPENPAEEPGMDAGMADDGATDPPEMEPEPMMPEPEPMVPVTPPEPMVPPTQPMPVEMEPEGVTPPSPMVAPTPAPMPAPVVMPVAPVAQQPVEPAAPVGTPTDPNTAMTTQQPPVAASSQESDGCSVSTPSHRTQSGVTTLLALLGVLFARRRRSEA